MVLKVIHRSGCLKYHDVKFQRGTRICIQGWESTGNINFLDEAKGVLPTAWMQTIGKEHQLEYGPQDIVS